MAVLGSTLLPLGLFLCFGLLCSSASSAGEIDKCMFFSEVTTTGPGIMVNSDVYDSNRNYTVWVPVNANISSVVLRAVDENNTSLGLWEKADELCNSSALYHLENLNDKLFTANWVSPNSENITTIELQDCDAIVCLFPEMTSSQLSTTRTTPRHISTTRTTPRTTSLANKTFLCPITSAIQILIIFLTSKLLS
uniref:Placenta-expressed transcript 1 protein n=1 Tax=Panthera leo TaxID=9689 RepID=A0A8C8XIX3_PANLE